MDAAADRGPLWDTGDDRSPVFAPVASAAVLSVPGRVPLSSRARAEPAVNEEPALEALFLPMAARAAG